MRSNVASTAVTVICVSLLCSRGADAQCPAGSLWPTVQLTFDDTGGGGTGTFTIANIGGACPAALSRIDVVAMIGGPCHEAGFVVATASSVDLSGIVLQPGQSTVAQWSYFGLPPEVLVEFFPVTVAWQAYAHFSIPYDDGSMGGPTFCCTYVDFPSVMTQEFGPSKAGSGGLKPTLATSVLPVLGEPFTVDISNGVGGAIGLFLVGVGPPIWAPSAVGTLLVTPDIVIPLALGGALGVPGAGSGALGAVLPPSVPAPISVQAWFQDGGAVKQVTHTNALVVWAGP